MPFSLILTSKNVVTTNSNNNQYSLVNPTGQYVFSKGDKVALAQATIPYSWRNITSAYGNNTFTFKWIDSTSITLTLPDGFYDVPSINTYLQSQMVTAGYYLINSTGGFEYYYSILTNSTYYAVQLVSYSLPTSLPAGWSYPSGVSWTTSQLSPQVVIPTTNSIGTIIGFNAGTYPASQSQAGVTYSILSQNTPEITPVQSILLQINIVNNVYQPGSSVIAVIPIPSGSIYGTNITYAVPQLIFNNISENVSTNNIMITLIDQNFLPIVILDTALAFQLQILKAGESS